MNPKNNKLHRTFEAITSSELETAIDLSYQRFRKKYSQGHAGLSRRFEKLSVLQAVLAKNKEEYAKLITQEMGKPITQSEAEIDKCISHCQYYIDNSVRHLSDEQLDVINPN